MKASNTLSRTLGVAVLLLPVAFLAWHALGSVLAAPSVWLCGWVLELWLPDLVSTTSLHGSDMLVQLTHGETGGQLLPAAQAENALAFRQDTRIISYAIPFFAALHFATNIDHPLERFARSLLLLWLLIGSALVCISLKQLLLILGDQLYTAANWVPPPAAIALAYQFFVLIIPSLAPVLLWAWHARDVPAFKSLFTPPPASAPQLSD